MRKASRTIVGMLEALTICRENFVSGFIDGHHVDDLEPGLLAAHDRLLAGDQDIGMAPRWA